MALAYHLAFDFENAEEMYDEAFCCRVGEDPRLPTTERLETASGRPDKLSPGEVYTTEGGYFAELLFRGLLMVDSELNVVPGMADNFRVSSDGLTYLFRIKEDARWSDGEPVTAEDFAYAWRRMRESGTRTAFLMEDVETAEPLDDRTLEVRLREPRSYFPYVLCSAWAFPWPRHVCESLGDDWAQPENLVGNGPFVLVEYDDDHALLRANPHWNGARGNVGEIHFSFFAKGSSMVEKWREGRFDLLHVYDPVADDEPLTVSDIVPELGLQYIGFCADRAPFSSELVRQAFSHAVDREFLVAHYPRSGLNRAASRGGAIPPAMPAHSHRVGLEYDLEKARSLLDEAGYPGGKGLPELQLIVPHWLQPVEPIAELWTPIGARVNVVTSPGHVDHQVLRDAHMWWTGWTADYPDPDGFFRGLLMLGQWPFYQDDDILELLERGRSLRDQGERMRVYHEVDQRWVGEHAAILPIAYPRSILLRRPWVQGLWATPLSRAHLDAVVVGERAVAEPDREEASAVPVPDEAQALERQERVDRVDRLRVRGDQLRQPTGGDDGRRLADLGAHPLDDAVHLAREAVDHARTGARRRSSSRSRSAAARSRPSRAARPARRAPPSRSRCRARGRRRRTRRRRRRCRSSSTSRSRRRCRARRSARARRRRWRSGRGRPRGGRRRRSGCRSSSPGRARGAAPRRSRARTPRRRARAAARSRRGRRRRCPRSRDRGARAAARRRTPSSSPVRSASVATRQCSARRSPSYSPKTVCVLPTSTARSMARCAA